MKGEKAMEWIRTKDKMPEYEGLYLIVRDGEIECAYRQNFLIDEGALSGIVTGAELSSEDFAKKIENMAVAGFGEIVFIIGGSFGLSHEVKALGSIKLSFGKLTLPHQLMRVVLLEQIYRAFTILNHTKYHK